MNLDKFTLTMGADIKIPEFPVIFHQPTLYEIAKLGEERFFNSLIGFYIDLNFLQKQENYEKLKESLNSDFSIFIELLQSDIDFQEDFLELSGLIFANYSLSLLPNGNIVFIDKENTDNFFIVTDNDFLIIKSVVRIMFNLDTKEKKSQFNPKDAAAEKIASKILQAQKKRMETKNGGKSDKEILSIYASVLAAGLNTTLVEVSKLTLYQLYEQLTRFNLKDAFEHNFTASLVGASVEIKDWRENDN